MKKTVGEKMAAGIFKRGMSGVVAGFLAVSLIFSMTACGGNKMTAVVMRLMKSEGEVTLTDEKDAVKSIIENMNLFTGYHLRTGSDSSAKISLDETKMITLAGDSFLGFEKEKKEMRLSLEEGELFFNIEEKLADDESLEIETSTMVVGIRGTSGVISADKKEVVITDGTVEVVLTNTETGESQTIKVEAGKKLVVTDTDANGNATEEGYILEDANLADLPEYVLEEIKDTPELAERVAEAYGITTDELLEKVDNAIVEKKKDVEEETEEQTTDDEESSTTEENTNQNPTGGRRRVVTTATNDTTTTNQTPTVVATPTSDPTPTTTPETTSNETPTEETPTAETPTDNMPSVEPEEETPTDNMPSVEPEEETPAEEEPKDPEEPEEPEEPIMHTVTISMGGANRGELSVMSDGKGVGTFNASTGVHTAEVEEGAELTIELLPAYYCTCDSSQFPTGMSEPTVQETAEGYLYSSTYTVGTSDATLTLPVEMMSTEENYANSEQSIRPDSRVVRIATYVNQEETDVFYVKHDSQNYTISGLSCVRTADLLQMSYMSLMGDAVPVSISIGGMDIYFKKVDSSTYYIDIGTGFVCSEDGVETSDHLYIIMNNENNDAPLRLSTQAP